MVQVKNGHLINREISWLSFNERVLQEAMDKSVPLVERIKFLGIFSNNRDEFFRVRVATIKRMTKMGSKTQKLIGEKPESILKKINKIVIRQQERFDVIYGKLKNELKKEQVYIINEKQIQEKHHKFARDYFHQKVLPSLAPVMISKNSIFPYLKDKSIYLIVKLINKKRREHSKHSLIEIPTPVVSRFLVLPSVNNKKHIILLEDLIRFCLNDIYSIFEYDTAEAYTIKITRDAELDIEEDMSASITEKISKSLKKRKKGSPVRLVYDREITAELLSLVTQKMSLKADDNLIAGGRYHNFKDFMKFPELRNHTLLYRKQKPLLHPLLAASNSVLKVIKKNDILLTYPYHSFHHTIDLLREASIDPKVKSIKITLYRASKNSNVVNALINAIKNGKKVIAVVELQARFDEEANIEWANKLREEGAHVIHGVPGLKVHSKLCLIERAEGRSSTLYAQISTGNYNEDTAKVYSDHSLLTANKEITSEVRKVFSFYLDNLKRGKYKHLVVSPFYMRDHFLKLINNEIKNARAGKEASIFLKLNSLVDPEMIHKLYEASNAGVNIKIIARGICCLMPGLKNISENIEAISIVDKYLEHSRVFIFHANGDELTYISSADWMQRNLDHRSEVAVPIYDTLLKAELKEFLEIQWSDNTKARTLISPQDNKYRRTKTKENINSQNKLYRYYSQHAKLLKSK
ncbi:MAG: polyphosphate kinase 1 [Bacteroidia bacterium]|nr:polyphosphate kinase 1 [Bacteroidia bacterium]